MRYRFPGESAQRSGNFREPRQDEEEFDKEVLDWIVKLGMNFVVVCVMHSGHDGGCTDVLLSWVKPSHVPITAVHVKLKHENSCSVF